MENTPEQELIFREDKLIRISWGMLFLCASVFFSCTAWVISIQVQAKDLEDTVTKHIEESSSFEKDSDKRWQEVHDSLIEIKTTLKIKLKDK